MIDPRPDGDHAGDVELEPAQIGRRHLGFVEINLKARRTIAGQPRAVGEFHDRPCLMEAGRADHPADLREWRAQVDEAAPIAQCCRARRCCGAGPQVVRHDIACAAASDELHLLARGSIECQLEIRIHDAALRRRPGAVIVGRRRERLPRLAEEERRPHRHRPRSRLLRQQGGRESAQHQRAYDQSSSWHHGFLHYIISPHHHFIPASNAIVAQLVAAAEMN